ncbi:hypothetical protein VPHD528_0206 [Vibrio phage D528]
MGHHSPYADFYRSPTRSHYCSRSWSILRVYKRRYRTRLTR